MTPKHTLPRLILLVAAALPLCGTARAGDAPSPEELRRMVADSAASLRIQTDFPREPANSTNPDGYPVEHDGTAGTPSVSHDFATATLYVALAVFVVVLLLSVYENLRPPGDPKKTKHRDAPGEGDLIRKRMHAVRLESDALADEGDYAGAMHVLLLQSVEEMRRRLGVPIAASLTSREILRRTKLQGAAHASLADIIGRVEVSWFGDHKPSAKEYAECRASFSILSGILGGGGQA